MAADFYQLWKFTAEEQRELLGTDIGTNITTIVVELDEISKRFFYNETFAPITIRQYLCNYPNPHEIFQVIVHSIDDGSLNMTWEVKDMDIPPHEARQQIESMLKRTNYFVNLRGFESFCSVFGKCTVDYN